MTDLTPNPDLIPHRFSIHVVENGYLIHVYNKENTEISKLVATTPEEFFSLVDRLIKRIPRS